MEKDAYLTPDQLANCMIVSYRNGQNHPKYSEFRLRGPAADSGDGAETVKTVEEFVRIPGAAELKIDLREIASLYERAKTKIEEDPLAKPVWYENIHSQVFALGGRERTVCLTNGDLTLHFSEDKRFYIRFQKNQPEQNSADVFLETSAIVKKNGDFVLNRNLIGPNKERPITTSQSWSLSKREIKQRELGTGFTLAVRDLKRLFNSYLGLGLEEDFDV